VYRIVVADLDDDAVGIGQADLTQRTAFVFGNELEGISDEARSLSDAAITIPMSGFADSLNISVAVSIVLYEAQRQRERRLGRTGDLSEAIERGRERSGISSRYGNLAWSSNVR